MATFIDSRVAAVEGVEVTLERIIEARSASVDWGC